MSDLATYTLRLPASPSLGLERTSSGRDLELALDHWLADDMSHDDYIHVHSWNDSEEAVQ